MEYTVYQGQDIPVTDSLVNVPVISYITVVDAGYDIDTDGDILVDAIDPNPTIPEPHLYTDSDGDGVPDATDAYPNEDDFVYVVFEDLNENGILDFNENL